MLLKKSLSIFLCAILVLSLCVFALPRTAKAYAASVFIGSFELDNANPYYRNGGTSGTATDFNAHYDTTTGVLTLQGLNAQADAYDFQYNGQYRGIATIYADGPLTINVCGDNSVSVPSPSYLSSGNLVVAAVYTKGDLTINGGALHIISRSLLSIFLIDNIECYSVLAEGDLTVSDCAVSADGVAVSRTAASVGPGSVSSFGIKTTGSITIHENAHIECKGGDASNADGAAIAYGVYAAGVTVSDGYLHATGGNIQYAGRLAEINSASCGIYTGSVGSYALVIKNSTVIAKSSAQNGNHKAIDVSNASVIQLSAPYVWRIDPADSFTTSSTVEYGWDSTQTYVEICPTDPAIKKLCGTGGSIIGSSYIVTANPGYEIDKVWVDGDFKSDASGSSYTPSTLPTQNIFACFKKTAAAVLVRAGYGGSINSTSYEVTAESGYVIDALWVDGAKVTEASGLANYTPGTPTSSIIATFAYTVNFNTPANGTLTVARGGNPLTSGTIVRGGEALTITAAPNANYTLSSLKVNGSAVTPVSNVYIYTVGTSPAAKRAAGGVNVLAQGAQIETTFVRSGAPYETYTVTYDKNSGGGTMASGTATQGAIFHLPACSFAAPSGRRFKEWAIGATDSMTRVAEGGSYTFTADTTVYAVWEDIPQTFVPVTNLIRGFTQSVAVNTDLPLIVTVEPSGATNRTVAWSVKNAGGTGAAVTGDVFRASAAGTATLTATITNGAAPSTAYTKDFTLTVTPEPADTGGVGGDVSDPSGKPAANADVEIKQGTVSIARTLTDANGRYSFTALPCGDYNIIVKKGTQTVTALIEIVSRSISDQPLSLPSEKISSLLEINNAPGEPDTPDIVVGGINDIVTGEPPNQVTVKLAVQSKAVDTGNAGHQAIKNLAVQEALDQLDIIEITLTKDGNDIGEVNSKVLEFVIPFDFTGKANVKLFRYHGGANGLTAISERPSSGAAVDGTYYLAPSKGFIYLYAKRFSPYAIACSSSLPVPPPGGGTVHSGAGGAIDRSITPPTILVTPVPEIPATGGGGLGVLLCTLAALGCSALQKRRRR